jgi:hypothetical protein
MIPQLQPTQCSALCPIKAMSCGRSPRLQTPLSAVPTLTSRAAELLRPAPCHKRVSLFRSMHKKGRNVFNAWHLAKDVVGPLHCAHPSDAPGPDPSALYRNVDAHDVSEGEEQARVVCVRHKMVARFPSSCANLLETKKLSSK